MNYGGSSNNEAGLGGEAIVTKAVSERFCCCHAQCGRAGHAHFAAYSLRAED
jgi:hypothetical protein